MQVAFVKVEPLKEIVCLFTRKMLGLALIDSFFNLYYRLLSAKF